MSSNLHSHPAINFLHAIHFPCLWARVFLPEKDISTWWIHQSSATAVTESQLRANSNAVDTITLSAFSLLTMMLGALQDTLYLVPFTRQKCFVIFVSLSSICHQNIGWYLSTLSKFLQIVFDWELSIPIKEDAAHAVAGSQKGTVAYCFMICEYVLYFFHLM